MFVEIIPYEKSFNTETLTYFVGASFSWIIKIWQLVKIPYGKTEILWIVAKIFVENTETSLEIKEIIEVIDEKPILSEYQIETIIKISKKYFLAIHRVLGIFLPNPVIKRLYKKNFPLSLSKEIIEKNSKKNSKLNWEFYFTKNNIITEKNILEKTKETNKKIVIIVPDDIFLYRMKKIFSDEYSEKVGFFSSEMTDIKKSDFWIDVFNSKFDIVIWTRKIIFYNLEKYDEIWYLEDSFYDSYYHYPIEISYTDILAFLFDNEKFDIKIFTSIPRIKTLSQFHFFKIFYL